MTWGLRDYGTGVWDGGNPDCDHLGPPGGGTNASGMGNYHGETREATNARVEKRRQHFRDVCGKCGATRVDQQLGLEATTDLFVAAMVDVFREVRRVLRADGTCWVNLGDSYAGGGQAQPQTKEVLPPSLADGPKDGMHGDLFTKARAGNMRVPGLKPKDLVGIPWRVAFALQADGWYLRSDIVWAKSNPMPESVTDRPTKAHEYVFLLTKSARYFFDAEAVREPHKEPWRGNGERETSSSWEARKADAPRQSQQQREGGVEFVRQYNPAGRNVRSVWEIATQPYPEAHFATFPEALPDRCIKAGCPEGGTVLDPFMGSGTTALVARRLGRRSIGIELNPDYAALCARRLQQLSLFAGEPA